MKVDWPAGLPRNSSCVSPILTVRLKTPSFCDKSLTFGVSALYTGVAGALGAIAVQFVAPDSFTFDLAIAMFVGLVIGGVFGGLTKSIMS